MEDKWIPYVKQEPKANNSYLVTLQFSWGKEVEIMNWIDGEWFEREIAHAVVAWRYLPEPWKGEKKE